jgi:1,2-diacylglycerol 3-alpha-glucosyltransferase
LKIPATAFVVGHVGRLAPEKNLEFVTRAVAQFMKNEPKAHFLIGGTGPSVDSIKEIMTKEGVIDRLHLAGMLKGKALVNAYQAMNVFVFASQSETQGLVVTEAMAAGVPVVAVDASGVREVVRDRINGRLLVQEDIKDFVSAIAWLKKQPPARLKKIKKACQETAHTFSMKECAQKALKIYVSLSVNKGFFRRKNDESIWSNAVRSIQTQWGLTKNLTQATRAFMSPVSPEDQNKDAESVPDLSDASHKN